MASQNVSSRDKMNWRIHMLYVRKDYVGCEKVIEQQLTESNGQSEYAIYVKGLVLRHKGQIMDSLKHFQLVRYASEPGRCVPSATRLGLGGRGTELPAARGHMNHCDYASLPWCAWMLAAQQCVVLRRRRS